MAYGSKTQPSRNCCTCKGLDRLWTSCCDPVTRRCDTLDWVDADHARQQCGRGAHLTWTDNETVAIEVETGKSDVLANVKNDLRSGFDRVIVVATDDAAMAKVEEKLAEVGLIMPTRVTLVLRDSWRKAA